MRRKQFEKGQKIMYRNKEYVFVGYTKTSPSGYNDQRVDLAVEGEDYIVEMHEKDLYDN